MRIGYPKPRRGPPSLWCIQADHRLHANFAFSAKIGGPSLHGGLSSLLRYLHPVHVSPSGRNKSKRSCGQIDALIPSIERAHTALEISKIQTEFGTNAPFTDQPQGSLMVRSCHDKNAAISLGRSKSSELVAVAWAYPCTPHMKQNSAGDCGVDWITA
jgi:hypothetical protein